MAISSWRTAPNAWFPSPASLVLDTLAIPQTLLWKVNIDCIFSLVLLVLVLNMLFRRGCIRDLSWPWWRQALPWWTLFFLVPIYSTCSSLSNLQYWRSPQLPIMVLFSCCAYAANRAASIVLPGRTDIVSAAGAFVIGSLGNIYSRVVRGTAFTSMVTGVLFLVPVRCLNPPIGSSV